MNKSKRIGGKTMTIQDRQLIVETLGEMRELKGEMREFKQNVIERVQKLEKKESERKKDRNSLFSVIIAFLALAVSIIVNFIRNGGKY
jgi:uncharacterized membrane protein (DUF106 family)